MQPKQVNNQNGPRGPILKDQAMIEAMIYLEIILFVLVACRMAGDVASEGYYVND